MAKNISQFQHTFQRGDKLTLKDVRDNNPMSRINPNFGIESGDQEVLYLNNYVSVGNRAIHQFVQIENGGRVNVYTIRDIGIKEVVDGVIIAKPGIGYGNVRLSSEKEREALELFKEVAA